jgi:DNA uptake protein ComE-like DNA-binding protein
MKRALAASGMYLLVLLVAGCDSHPSNEQIQQQAAKTTEQVKQGAQQAADKTRAAAATAEDKLNAVAAGVKQGLNGTGSPAIDLNSATAVQLETLPGISSARAHRIIAGRPYLAPADLVTKNILKQEDFDRISAKIQVK